MKTKWWHGNNDLENAKQTVVWSTMFILENLHLASSSNSLIYLSGLTSVKAFKAHLYKLMHAIITIQEDSNKKSPILLLSHTYTSFWFTCIHIRLFGLHAINLIKHWLAIYLFNIEVRYFRTIWVDCLKKYHNELLCFIYILHNTVFL